MKLWCAERLESSASKREVCLPPSDEAHVWYARTDKDRSSEFSAACLDLLSPDELTRFHRLRVDRSRYEFLVARVLCRRTLSRYAGVEPRMWGFRSTRHGRPLIDRPAWARPLRFNLSKTLGMVACVVTHQAEAGLDVEALDRPHIPVEAASRWFASCEARELATCRDEDRKRRFLEYWTLKEAYVKARGLGLSLPLDRFAFSISASDDIEVSFEPGFDRAGRWQFALLQPTPEHVMAVAVERLGNVTMRLRVYEDALDGAWR